MYNMKKPMLVAAFVATGIFFATAQKGPEKNWNSARIEHELGKMQHVGRVLYIAAHPDDENTQLISYLVNVKGIETAYMSLTRGDGGQDLIGPEVREELGVIRTQELLMARATDGGEQFFSRANDFGFSKTAKESMHIWDSTQVLSDIVWVIRKFKPDMIITRFSPTYAKTHGHHQASAQLAVKAFAAAADSTQFPEQLKYVSTWQATSLFWNTSYFFFQDNKFDTAGLYHTNIGTYMPLLGKSVGEMASESRSMHKSQGFGVAARRGDIMEYFVSLAGKKPDNRDIFSVVNFNWDRIKGCEKIPDELNKLIAHFDKSDPVESISWVISLIHKLEPYKSNYLVAYKIQQLQKILLQCAGTYTEAISTKKFLCPGDSINVSLNTIEEAAGYDADVHATLMIDGKELCDFKGTGILPEVYQVNTNKTLKASAIIPDTIHPTGPYWLEQDPTVGMYRVDNQKLRGLPQNPSQVTVRLHYHFHGNGLCNACPEIDIDRYVPVFYKNVDPVKGEQYAEARIVPPAVIIPQTKLLVFASNNAKELDVKVKSFIKGKAALKLDFPTGWADSVGGLKLKQDTKGMSYTDSITLNGDGTEQTYKFYIKPLETVQNATINISIIKDGKIYNRSLEDINYDHIPEQILLPKSKVKLVKMDIKTSHKLIGYINGAGDDIPQMLKELGYTVEIISPTQLASANLSKYDVIIAGVRAYNTVDRLKYDNPRLMDYVKNGGTYIVQYNNNFRLETENIGPYPLTLSGDRTTEEDCKVTFVHPDNPVLNTPNKITDADFTGWVQERGLYYPNKWDSNYTPILEMADGGEKPTQGALLIAQYGKGNFVYTGLSFFRELPAGVTGAYRLFVNLVELPKHGK
jgi:LmbE family N-acetylglucosaminyl deacetylase